MHAETPAQYLKAQVETLATEIGERNSTRPRELSRAADYLKSTLEKMGYSVRTQEFTHEGQTFRNLEAERKGSKNAASITVIGAHYDTVPGSPGANDNASGVAANLLLARRFATAHPAGTLRFVFFANEEPPFFQTEGMGSWRYAQECRARKERIEAMISLETVGYFSDQPDSQRFPLAPLKLIYPSTGNFIALVGNLGSRKLAQRIARSFRAATKLPIETAVLPEAVPGVGWSDHWAFWKAGYPGVMVTDTAPFRYPHYHLRTDRPEQLDYARMSAVVEGIARVVEDLAEIK